MFPHELFQGYLLIYPTWRGHPRQCIILSLHYYDLEELTEFVIIV